MTKEELSNLIKDRSAIDTIKQKDGATYLDAIIAGWDDMGALCDLHLSACEWLEWMKTQDLNSDYRLKLWTDVSTLAGAIDMRVSELLAAEPFHWQPRFPEDFKTWNKEDRIAYIRKTLEEPEKYCDKVPTK